VSAADDLAVLARVTVSLVVVVALAVLAARFARRAGVRGAGAGLRVVERTGLTREASVAVVEVAGRGLVVGVTPHGVTLLLELEAGEIESRGIGTTLDTGVVVEEEPGSRRIVVPAGGTHRRSGSGTGTVLDPRTWRQAVEALRDLTARRR
jgi:flagellar biogenesis protein FliO